MSETVQPTPKYKRILLKLSGEALMGDDSFGINRTVLQGMVEEIKSVVELGVEVGIVVGGGNIFRGVALGAGEILLTSVDNEGLQQGMDLELIEAVTKAVNVPVICGGGVGCGDDIVDAANAGADAVACAAVLHYKKETVTELKEDIRAGGVEVRQV